VDSFLPLKGSSLGFDAVLLAAVPYGPQVEEKLEKELNRVLRQLHLNSRLPSCHH
jgi:hypothetical protein